jgi:hypothetical protein
MTNDHLPRVECVREFTKLSTEIAQVKELRLDLRSWRDQISEDLALNRKMTQDLALLVENRVSKIEERLSLHQWLIGGIGFTVIAAIITAFVRGIV